MLCTAVASFHQMTSRGEEKKSPDPKGEKMMQQKKPFNALSSCNIVHEKNFRERSRVCFFVLYISYKIYRSSHQWCTLVMV